MLMAGNHDNDVKKYNKMLDHSIVDEINGYKLVLSMMMMMMTSMFLLIR